MKLDCRCLKCGAVEYEVKNIYIPEKKHGGVAVDIGLYYYKICLECGFVEIYSAKIVEKNEKFNFVIQTAPV